MPTGEERGEGKGSGVLLGGRVCPGFFVLRLFIFLWLAGILGEVSEKGLNRIFISFPSVSFNMLICQNVLIEGSGLCSA